MTTQLIIEMDLPASYWEEEETEEVEKPKEVEEKKDPAQLEIL
jgi:hypothetical protein